MLLARFSINSDIITLEVTNAVILGPVRDKFTNLVPSLLIQDVRQSHQEDFDDEQRRETFGLYFRTAQ